MDWKDYEIYIHQHFEKCFPDSNIQYNIRKEGLISKISRQIDILIEGRIAGFDMLIIVDCKYFSKKIDVKIVESFLSFLSDLKASKGVLITNKGYSKAAYNRAMYDTQDIELRIIDFKDLEEFQDFAAVVYSRNYCIYLPAPNGWVIDAHVFQGSAASIVPAGLTVEDSVEKEGFIYVAFSHVDSKFPDLQTLIEFQEKRVKKRYPNSKFEYFEEKLREERVVLRTAEISEQYNGPEHTLFIDFKEFHFYLVLLTPRKKSEFYLKKLRWVTEKLIAANLISNLKGEPISIHKLKK